MYPFKEIWRKNISFDTEYDLVTGAPPSPGGKNILGKMQLFH
jgi:hypothetical protein